MIGGVSFPGDTVWEMKPGLHRWQILAPVCGETVIRSGWSTSLSGGSCIKGWAGFCIYQRSRGVGALGKWVSHASNTLSPSLWNCSSDSNLDLLISTSSTSETAMDLVIVCLHSCAANSRGDGIWRWALGELIGFRGESRDVVEPPGWGLVPL